ncbi:unnamed protein product [Adineta ricciae]|uniref:Uncharacterized protein n=1 Tax=Adineta ricciae TaxID=249248 RepID=A0A815PS81_ADIRI|nr:unnamed protein product [Adineta ricciae]CAF1656047.1 unnamed protein product [Adineta ricciae]
MVKSNQKTNKVVSEKLDPKSLNTNPQRSNPYSTVVYNDNAPKASPKSKCSISRIICVQLCVLLGLLVLAAIIIPIVVLVKDNTSQTPACSKTYSDTFINGVSSSSQCAAWQSFLASLTCTTYSTLRIYGSNDPVGIVLNDPNVVTALAVALRYNTSIIAPSNGVNWRAYLCSGGMEITTTGCFCCCSVGYILRPCWNSGYWGGILTTPCVGPTQTLSIHFE